MHSIAASVLLAAASLPVAAQACDWELLPTPNPGGELLLFGLDSDDAGSIWTVGYQRIYEFSNLQVFNYAARWDGTQWVQTPVPQPSTLREYQHLAGVLSISTDEAIAVGTFNPDSGSSLAQSMRWDGSDWNMLNSPAYSGGSGFAGIGRAGQDIWACGYKYSELPPPAAGTFPMAARLEGNSWEVLFVPPLAETGGRSTNYIRAIAGANENDVWGAGNAQQVGTNGFGPAAMMVHYDGSDWSQYDLFPILNSIAFSSLQSLAVVGSDDVWAAGYDYDISRQVTIPLILHWDGSAWSNIPVPTFTHTAEFRAIAARSSTEVYASGTQADANGYPHALVLRYDGAEWTEVPQSAIVDYGTWFRAMDFDGDTLWTAGQANFLSEGLAQRAAPCGSSCAADFNTDGQLNFFDIAAYIDAYNAHDVSADMDSNGQFNFFDIAGFIDTYSAGCP